MGGLTRACCARALGVLSICAQALAALSSVGEGWRLVSQRSATFGARRGHRVVVLPKGASGGGAGGEVLVMGGYDEFDRQVLCEHSGEWTQRRVSTAESGHSRDHLDTAESEHSGE